MKKAALPPNEIKRQHALESYDIIGTEIEMIFDGITKLAASVCEVPICLISLIDNDRQWFKSHYGLDATETPRDISFCGHAINQTEVFYVPDSTIDERFKDNPLVTGAPNVIFYAGQPLIDKNGYALGTLCVIDNVPRHLSTNQLEQLRLLGDQAMQLIHIRLNISQIKSLNKQLAQASKLAYLGEISAGVAHEVNNPLTIITSGLELIPLFINNSEKLDSTLVKIKKSCHRIEKIIQGLQRYSRSSEADVMSIFSLDQILQETIAMMEYKLKDTNTNITVQLDKNLNILCNEVEIEQVIINLIGNAIDAIKHLEDQWVKIELKKDEKSAILRITDSGPGISEQIRERLFDPFFTTKKIGEGTGLGLSIAKGIIDSHHGSLRVVPDVSNTCFEIIFKLI
jgi:signal transduction histidine kinase